MNKKNIKYLFVIFIILFIIFGIIAIKYHNAFIHSTNDSFISVSGEIVSLETQHDFKMKVKENGNDLISGDIISIHYSGASKNLEVGSNIRLVLLGTAIKDGINYTDEIYIE